MVVLLTIFALAYMAVIFEHKLHIDKSIPVLLGSALMWAHVSLTGTLLVGGSDAEHAITHHLSEIGGIVFFLIGAMTIVNTLDKRGSLQIIQSLIKADNQIKMVLVVTLITFILSAVLDNLTTTIVMIAILQKIIRKRGDLLVMGVIIISAANAGGAWSPIGDVTTTMLWLAKKVTTKELVFATLPASLTQAFFLPLVFAVFPKILTRMTHGIIELSETKEVAHDKEYKGKIVLLVVGILGLLFVPVFKQLTHLPPFLGMMFSLSIVLIVNEYYNQKSHKEYHLTYHHMLEKVEWNAILFFTGILLCIGVFQSVEIQGQSSLIYLGELLQRPSNLFGMVITLTHDKLAVVFGLASSVIDNIPIMSAAMSMFTFPADHWFWHLLAYTAGTGGSILVIGSAAGVVAQSMLKIDFIWYAKKFSLPITLSYLAGVGVFFLQRAIITS